MQVLLQYLSPEPVTLVRARLAARVDDDDGALDAAIQSAITAAREQAEHITGRRYRSAKLRVELADWPAAGNTLPIYGPWACAISYWTGEAWAELAPAAYAFGPAGLGGNATAVLPAEGAWPILGPRLLGARVRIDLSAGPLVVMDNAATPPVPLPPVVPGCVEQYICAHVSAVVRQPEALVGAQFQVNPLIERLLDAERLWA